MKIYLTRDDVLEILAKHFGLEFISSITAKGIEVSLVSDELHWEGNEDLRTKGEGD